MKTTKQARSVQQIELVETYNLAQSLKRIENAPGYDADAKRKRALFHAVSMTESFTVEERKNLRIALNIP